MLMSAGVDLPKQIAVHGWMTVDGKKISKSIGNVINPLELTDKYALDSVRYFLMREIQFDSDGDYSEAKFLERYNADLANGIGNLTNRILVMIEKYCDSVVPETIEANDEIINFAKQISVEYNEAIKLWRFDRALESAWKFIAYCDQMIWPIMPGTSEKMFILLGLDVPKELAKPLSELQSWVGLTVGNKIQKPEPLFPRLS